MTKMLSASGGLCPPDQGLCPWTPLGALPPDPRYRLVLPLAMVPPSTTDPFRRLWLQISTEGRGDWSEALGCLEEASRWEVLTEAKSTSIASKVRNLMNLGLRLVGQ